MMLLINIRNNKQEVFMVNNKCKECRIKEQCNGIPERIKSIGLTVNYYGTEHTKYYPYACLAYEGNKDEIRV